MLRTINQEQAKEEMFDALNDESVLVIMDWAMKYERLLRQGMKELACFLRCI